MSATCRWPILNASVLRRMTSVGEGGKERLQLLRVFELPLIFAVLTTGNTCESASVLPGLWAMPVFVVRIHVGCSPGNTPVPGGTGVGAAQVGVQSLSPTAIVLREGRLIQDIRRPAIVWSV